MGNKNIILSVKPEYCYKLISGEKQVEFRKRIFRRSVYEIYIYATKPIGKIVAKFRYAGYEFGTPKEVWARYGCIGGIGEGQFFKYAGGSKILYAILVKDLHKIGPLGLDFFSEVKHPPQSFCYIARRNGDGNLASNLV